MGFLIVLSIIALLLFLLFVHPQLFLIRINRNSMYPTLKDGQIRVAYRKCKLRQGAIYIYDDGTGRPVIKRLKKIMAATGVLWFEGDNPAESYDSRHYGFVSQDKIIGKMLTKK